MIALNKRKNVITEHILNKNSISYLLLKSQACVIYNVTIIFKFHNLAERHLAVV